MHEIQVLHSEIRACRTCAAAGYNIEAPPLASGNAPAPFMLIGQAPSRTDCLQERMYTGPAAVRLFAWLKRAGFTEEDFGSVLYLTALTKCFPGRLPGKSTDRAPSSRELTFCADWLRRQIALVQPDVVILFGKMAVDRFLGPGPMTERIGTQEERNDVLFIPLPHSSGASTWLNSDENRLRLDRALDLIGAALELHRSSAFAAP